MLVQISSDILQFFMPAERAEVELQRGSFIIREGMFNVVATDPISMDTFWRAKAVACPKLAKFALGLLCIAPTEAAVERAFSHRKLLHNPLRNALQDASVEALMFVRMNAPLLGAIDA